MADEHRIIDVLAGAFSDNGSGAEFHIRTPQGEAIMRVAADALAPLGSLCLHAATNGPDNAALAVTSVRHQRQPDGTEAIGLQRPDGHCLWFSFQGTEFADLLEFLQTAIGAKPPPAPGVQH
jgi:hypothetical protein